MKTLLKSPLALLLLSLTAASHAGTGSPPCWFDQSTGQVCCALPADHSTDIACEPAQGQE